MRWSFLAHRGTRCHQAIGGAKSTRQIAPFGSPNQQLVHGIKRLAIVEKRESKSGVPLTSKIGFYVDPEPVEKPLLM